MQFSHLKTQPFKQKSWFERFSDQPHQLFFASTLFFAFYTMIGTFLSLIGKEVDFSLLHSFGLLFGVFTNAFLGFLMTVIPRYSTSLPIPQQTYLFVWIALQIGTLLTLFGFVLLGKMLVVGSLVATVAVFYKVIKRGKSLDKKESYLLSALVFLGAMLLLGEIVFAINLSILIFYGYLLNVVFLVALKMVPNFYSVYTQKPKWQKPKYILEFSLLLFLSIGVVSQFELLFLSKILASIALVFFGYIVLNLNIYGKTPPIILIMVVSFIWFYVGVIFYFVETVLETYTMKLSLHTFALGFVLNLLIGFGSRVTMGHAVPPLLIVADRFLVGLFVLMQIVIVSRVLGSLFYASEINFFMGFFHLSSTLWIVLFLGWGIRYGKTILRIAR